MNDFDKWEAEEAELPVNKVMVGFQMEVTMTDIKQVSKNVFAVIDRKTKVIISEHSSRFWAEIAAGII